MTLHEDYLYRLDKIIDRLDKINHEQKLLYERLERIETIIYHKGG